jgi:HPt (histidine-containing phosphotransfer) domain-containing protein
MTELAKQLDAVRIKFLNGLPSRIEAIDKAHTAQDWQQLNELGHTLKGTSACLGLAEISAIGSKIQSASRESDGDTIVLCLKMLGAHLLA